MSSNDYYRAYDDITKDIDDVEKAIDSMYDYINDLKRVSRLNYEVGSHFNNAYLNKQEKINRDVSNFINDIENKYQSELKREENFIKYVKFCDDFYSNGLKKIKELVDAGKHDEAYSFLINTYIEKLPKFDCPLTKNLSVVLTQTQFRLMFTLAMKDNASKSFVEETYKALKINIDNFSKENLELYVSNLMLKYYKNLSGPVFYVTGSHQLSDDAFIFEKLPELTKEAKNYLVKKTSEDFDNAAKQSFEEEHDIKKLFSLRKFHNECKVKLNTKYWIYGTDDVTFENEFFSKISESNDAIFIASNIFSVFMKNRSSQKFEKIDKLLPKNPNYFVLYGTISLSILANPEETYEPFKVLSTAGRKYEEILKVLSKKLDISSLFAIATVIMKLSNQSSNGFLTAIHKIIKKKFHFKKVELFTFCYYYKSALSTNMKDTGITSDELRNMLMGYFSNPRVYRHAKSMDVEVIKDTLDDYIFNNSDSKSNYRQDKHLIKKGNVAKAFLPSFRIRKYIDIIAAIALTLVGLASGIVSFVAFYQNQGKGIFTPINAGSFLGVMLGLPLLVLSIFFLSYSGRHTKKTYVFTNVASIITVVLSIFTIIPLIVNKNDNDIGLFYLVYSLLVTSLINVLATWLPFSFKNRKGRIPFLVIKILAAVLFITSLVLMIVFKKFDLIIEYGLNS